MFTFWSRSSAATSCRAACAKRGTARRQRHIPAVERLEDRYVPSTLIPVQNHRDLVYDQLRNTLDITTSTGVVQQFYVPNQQQFSGFSVSPSNYAADLSTDGNSLYLTDPQTYGSQALLRQFNLNSGKITNYAFTRASSELGTYGLAIAANGKALFDTSATNQLPE